MTRLYAILATVVLAVGLGAIANAAHIAGLVSGGVLGAAFGALSRMQGRT